MNSKDFYAVWDDSFVIDQASKGFSKDAGLSKAGSFGVRPSYAASSVVNLIRKDEMVNSCLATKVDATVSAGDFLESSNKRNEAFVNKLFKDNRWAELRRQLLWNLFSFGNCFLEIVRDGNGVPKELHVLETTEMEIIDDDGHGVPNLYVQRTNGVPQLGQKNSDVNVVEFLPDDIVHFRLDRLTTSLWAEIPVRPLDQYIGTKFHIKRLLWTMFKKNLFRNSLEYPEGASEDDVKKSAAFLKESLNDNDKPLVMFGGITSKPFSTFEHGNKYIELINKIDSAILSQMQVPPIMAGVPDNSGRASGEQETYKAFNTHIRGVQLLFAAVINNDLFPKLGVTGVNYRFGELDRKSEKDVIDMLIQLKALGAKAKKLEQYARDQGLDLPKGFFNPKFFEAPDKAANDAMTNKTAPSRGGKSDGSLSERVGTGSDGTTREEQMVTQAFNKLIGDRL